MTEPTPRRLRSVTYGYELVITDAGGETRRHDLAICVARDDGLTPREVCFVGRGRIGQGLDLMLVDLGIAISRALQDRDPATGEAPP